MMTTTTTTTTITSKAMMFATLVFALACSQVGVHGNAMGAQTCIGDRSAPGQPHRGAGYEERPISAGSITIRVGGETVEMGKAFAFYVGTTYDVVITKPTPFRGIMTRINGGDADIDTSLVFTLAANETMIKPNQFCDSDIGGITHTSAEEKTELSFQMTFDAPSRNLGWDINMVERNDVQISRFYYNQFIVQVLNPGETLAPTPPPTMPPTFAPTEVASAATPQMTTMTIPLLLSTASLVTLVVGAIGAWAMF